MVFEPFLYHHRLLRRQLPRVTCVLVYPEYEFMQMVFSFCCWCFLHEMLSALQVARKKEYKNWQNSTCICLAFWVLRDLIWFDRIGIPFQARFDFFWLVTPRKDFVQIFGADASSEDDSDSTDQADEDEEVWIWWWILDSCICVSWSRCSLTFVIVFVWLHEFKNKIL